MDLDSQRLPAESWGSLSPLVLMGHLSEWLVSGFTTISFFL